MIRATALFAASTLVAVCAHAATITVNVQSQSGTPVLGAQVMAAAFDNNYPGPDPTKTVTGVTDASGAAALTIQDNVGYEIFASSQGFLPAVVDQMNNPGHPHVQGTGALSAVTVMIDSTGVSGVGEIDVDVQGAQANALVVADVAPANGGDPVAVGFTTTDGSGNAGNGSAQPAIKLVNVPYTSSYRVEGQNLVKKTFFSFSGTTALSAGSPFLYYFAANGNPALTSVLNFSQAIASQQTQSSQSSGGGSASLQGAVVDPAGNAIPGVGLNFLYCSTDPVYIANNGGAGNPNACWTHIFASADQSGSVTLNGLQNHTTYYAQINGTCINGTCYQGSTSSNFTTQTQGAAPGSNDFVYDGTPLLKQFSLQPVAGGSGHMAVYVKDNNGNPLPGSWVNIYPDFSNCSGAGQNPGYSQFNGQATTGYVLVPNLLPGRYNINVGTQFSTNPTWFNAGADGQSNCDSDDLVVLVDTSDPSGTGEIYITQKDGVTSAGYAPHLSSVTVNVTLATNNSGTVAGTITLSHAADLSADPITLSLFPQDGCQNGPCQGGFAVITNAVGQTTGPVINYQIHVGSGVVYQLHTQSNYWGQVLNNGGGSPTVDLSNAASVTANMVFAPAGRIVGKLYNPDGTLFVPTQGSSNSGASIQAQCESSWGYAPVNNDGTYAIGGMMPGSCTMSVQGYGGYSYTNKQPQPKVTVAANTDSYSDVQTVNAQTVALTVNTANLQPLPPTTTCTYGHDHCIPEAWGGYFSPHGTPLSSDLLLDMLDVGSANANQIGYRPLAGQNGSHGCDGGGSGTLAGFCDKKVPSPNVYDFRLMRVGQFDNTGAETVAARPYFVVLDSTQSIAVDAAHANATPAFVPEFGSTVTIESVNVDPGSQLGISTAVFVGTVTAQNLITQHDFQQLGGDFQNFLKYLPIVALYDSSGTLVAGGLTVPYPPAENPFDARLSSDVATGNWADFSALTSAVSGWGPMGFDIRGIPAGTYTLILTTPNYPLYSTKVTLAPGTNRLDINLDTAVGQGATLTGTITDSQTHLPLANVPVSLSADNYPAQTVTTDNSGVYTRLGLPGGQFTVAPTLAGYALNSAIVGVPANTTVTQNFAMTPASGQIFGSVADAGASHALLVGAKVLAYDQTASIANPAAAQTLYSVQTDTTGVYHLTGLLTGDTYYVSVEAQRTLSNGAVIEYYVTSLTTTAANGVGNELDFSLAKKPLDINVVGHASTDKTAFDFSILNPGNFSNGDAWIGESPFSKLTSTDVAQGPSSWGTFQNFTDSQGRTYLALHYLNTGLLNPANTQVLHVEALSHDSATGKDTVYVKEVSFSAGGSASTTQSFDRALLGDGSDNDLFVGRKSNEVPISDDATQNPSAVSFPVGSLLPVTSTAVPTLSFTAQDAAQTLASQSLMGAVLRTSGISASVVSGQIYNLTLSSANYVAGGPGIDVSLAYNKQDTNLADLALYHYNTTTKQWDIVPGTQTIDPIKGTVTARLRSLSVPAGLRNNSALLAQAVGGKYRTAASVALVPDDNGLFAILHPSGVQTNGYAGGVLNAFNFPNPFNLFDKVVPISNGGATTTVPTSGTVIKYEIPAGAGGHVYIRIYTITGQLVKEIDEGDKSGGTFNYTVWDGHNSSGSPVANGIYYGIVSVPGTKVKDGTFKLAVIK